MGVKFINPGTLGQALELLAEYQDRTVILNGGTDLTEKIKKSEVTPDYIIYIHELAQLKGIRMDGKYFFIGGAESYTATENNPFCKSLPALAQAIAQIASPAIKNIATPAGNIGSAMPAGDCNIALLALGARIVLCDKEKEKEIPLSEVFVAPGKTSIKPNQLIKAIKIPRPEFNEFSSFVKLTRRQAQDIAQVAVAVSLKLCGEICQDIRIVLGAVNPVPVRAFSLEKMIIGRSVREGLAQIKNVFPPETNPRNDRFKDYKYMVVNSVIEKAVLKAYQTGAGGV